MANSIYKTLPLCAGSLVTSGPWSSLLARAGYRVYPYQLGAMVASDGTTNPVSLHGLGDFTASGGTNYVMACSAEDYGDSTLYIPDVTRIRAISTVSGSNDELDLGSDLTIYEGEYLLNLGTDSGNTNPLITPAYNGSTITIYSSPVGAAADEITNGYVLTGSQGQFRCWTETGWLICDLLVTDSSGNPLLVIPGFSLGPEILA